MTDPSVPPSTGNAPGHAPRDLLGHWLPLLAGLGLIAAGLYWVVLKGSRQIGPLLACTGLILLPWPPLAVIGGLGFVGVGVYECVHFKTVTLLGGVLIVLGVLTIADRGGRALNR